VFEVHNWRIFKSWSFLVCAIDQSNQRPNLEFSTLCFRVYFSLLNPWAERAECPATSLKTSKEGWKPHRPTSSHHHTFFNPYQLDMKWSWTKVYDQIVSSLHAAAISRILDHILETNTPMSSTTTPSVEYKPKVKELLCRHWHRDQDIILYNMSTQRNKEFHQPHKGTRQYILRARPPR
jgi:hypothetical protein